MLQAIHIHEDKWYFWDEVWAHRLGPYDNEYDAAIEYIRYVNAIEGRKVLMELQYVQEEATNFGTCR